MYSNVRHFLESSRKYTKDRPQTQTPMVINKPTEEAKGSKTCAAASGKKKYRCNLSKDTNVTPAHSKIGR